MLCQLGAEGILISGQPHQQNVWLAMPFGWRISPITFGWRLPSAACSVLPSEGPELVGVEGEKAFVTMGGGCQGCSMSAATLQEGIQRAILEAVPEITEVVDTTDHDQGENPYYT